MHLYLAIQSTYDQFELALFRGNALIDLLQEDKRHTSKLLIPLLDQLLSKNAITFAQLSFCAVNCGPAPFSTLRSILATVNGLHCATQIPLMSVDGLEATWLEFRNPQTENIIVMLNAFNNESYYLLAYKDTIISTGYKKTELLHQEIEQQFSVDKINVINNKICSIATIARIGYEKFVSQSTPTAYLMPLHLKKHPVEEK